MTSSGGVVALLFTDLVRSTELLTRLGDDAADELRRRHFAGLRQAVAASGGEEIKSLGDGLMVSFTSPVAALSCAVAMQGSVEGSGLELRVGVHAGEPKLATILDTPGRARTVVEEETAGGLAYGISHPLVQETIYQSIGGARRRVLHREVGRSLLAAGQSAAAAPHFARSARIGDGEAIDALRLALREAEDRRAYREALAMLSGLFNLLPEGDERWLQIADVISGEAQWAEHPDSTRADKELGIRALEAIDTVLGPHGDPVRRGTLKVRLSQMLTWGVGDTVGGERVAGEAEALFAGAGDRRNAVLARHEAVWARGLGGDMTTMNDESKRIFSEAESLGDTLLKALAITALTQSELTAGRFAEAQRAMELGVSFLREGLGRPPTVFRATGCLSEGLQGRHTAATRLWEEARAADPDYQFGPYVGMRLVAAGFTGWVAEAVSVAEDRLAWSGPTMTPKHSTGFAMAAYAARETGTAETARRYLALSSASRSGREWWIEGSIGDGVAALLDADDGRQDSALERLPAAAERLERSGAAPFVAFLLLEVAEIAGRAQDERADRAAHRLAEIAEILDRDIYSAMATLAAGWAAFGEQNPDRSAHARQALTVLESTELRLLRGRAYDLLGRYLASADAAGAREAFSKAIAEFESCGAALRRDRAAADLERLPS